MFRSEQISQALQASPVLYSIHLRIRLRLTNGGCWQQIPWSVWQPQRFAMRRSILVVGLELANGPTGLSAQFLIVTPLSVFGPTGVGLSRPRSNASRPFPSYGTRPLPPTMAQSCPSYLTSYLDVGLSPCAREKHGKVAAFAGGCCGFVASLALSASYLLGFGLAPRSPSFTLLPYSICVLLSSLPPRTFEGKPLSQRLPKKG